MQPEMIDFVFWGFIALVVVVGLLCLVVFLPREHEYEEKTQDCYRIVYRDGNYSISHKKPRYGENSFSLRSKYFYIRKSPFVSEAFCDEAVSKNGRNLRGTAAVTVYFPEDKLQIFAPTFHNIPHESIAETVEETVSAALTEAIEQYDENSGADSFEAYFKEVAAKKLAIFGLIPMSVKDIRVSENK